MSDGRRCATLWIYLCIGCAEKDGKGKRQDDLGGKRDFSFYTDEVVEKVASTAVNMQ